MPRYRVLIERLIEEEVVVEAENSTDAVDLVLEGGGEEFVPFEWAPQVILTEEIT